MKDLSTKSGQIAWARENPPRPMRRDLVWPRLLYRAFALEQPEWEMISVILPDGGIIETGVTSHIIRDGAKSILPPNWRQLREKAMGSGAPMVFRMYGGGILFRLYKREAELLFAWQDLSEQEKKSLWLRILEQGLAPLDKSPLTQEMVWGD